MGERIDVGIAERGGDLADGQAFCQKLLGYGDLMLNAVLHGREAKGFFELLAEGIVIDPALLGDLCGRFFMGKSQMCKLFEEQVGESPIEYYGKLKMAEAKRLLRRDELSVSRISDMLGYSSIHNI